MAAPDAPFDPARYGLDALRAVIDRADAHRPSVSSWSVGEQVSHCALASGGIAKALIVSEPPVPPRGINLTRTLILGLGWIPRGRAQAPEIATPADAPPADELHAALDDCEQVLARAEGLGTDAWFRHFALGVMDRDAALRFIAVHNRHHLKIVGDILR